MGILGPEILAFLRGETAPDELNSKIKLKFGSFGTVFPLKRAKVSGPNIPMNSWPIFFTKS